MQMTVVVTAIMKLISVTPLLPHPGLGLAPPENGGSNEVYEDKNNSYK